MPYPFLPGSTAMAGAASKNGTVCSCYMGRGEDYNDPSPTAGLGARARAVKEEAPGISPGASISFYYFLILGNPVVEPVKDVGSVCQVLSLARGPTKCRGRGYQAGAGGVKLVAVVPDGVRLGLVVDSVADDLSWGDMGESRSLT